MTVFQSIFKHSQCFGFETCWLSRRLFIGLHGLVFYIFLSNPSRSGHYGSGPTQHYKHTLLDGPTLLLL
ncbi:hypothetical protein BVRB_6g141650 [Beta vulgaris subsp. vulgaris]|nr:hypothetical protein BVRB_6g141650 [Beta vulgaris subsp. vulgaris]